MWPPNYFPRVYYTDYYFGATAVPPERGTVTGGASALHTVTGGASALHTVTGGASQD